MKKEKLLLEAKTMVLVPQETLVQLIAGQERILRVISEKAEKKDSIGCKYPQNPDNLKVEKKL